MYFKGSCGIRQVCLICPYLFLLVIEGLNRFLLKDNDTQLIKGIKVVGSLFLTHTLFVDDVLIFGDGSLFEWIHIKNLVDLFCGASGMFLSPRKSCFSYYCLDQCLIDDIALHLPFKLHIKGNLGSKMGLIRK